MAREPDVIVKPTVEDLRTEQLLAALARLHEAGAGVIRLGGTSRPERSFIVTHGRVRVRIAAGIYA